MATRSPTDCNVGEAAEVGIEELPEAVNISSGLCCSTSLRIASLANTELGPQLRQVEPAPMELRIPPPAGVNHSGLLAPDYSPAAAEQANKAPLAFFTQYLGWSRLAGSMLELFANGR